MLSINTSKEIRSKAIDRPRMVFLAIVFLAFFISVIHTGPAMATETGQTPTISSAEALVVDSDGTELYALNADTSMPMASTTKIMTAVIAIESGLDFDTTYTFSQAASTVDGTTAGYAQGDTAKLGDMLKVMMALSAGDAAHGIAECVSGSVDAFVAQMNAKAVELGMTGTHYTSPDGYYDTDHYSTPRDILILARHAMTLPAFRSIVGSKQVTVPIGATEKTFTNTDVFLDSYPGMMGIKTGYTYGAGYCFVGAAQRGGITIYTCVLNAPTEDDRVADTRTLLEWGFSQYPVQALQSSDTGSITLGYTPVGSTFGRSAAYTIASATARLAVMDTPSVLTDGVISYTGAPVMPSSVMASISWYTLDQARPVVARTASIDSPVSQTLPTTSFGPFVSQLFYELDARGV